MDSDDGANGHGDNNGRFCPNCGRAHSKNIQFCEACGTRFSAPGTDRQYPQEQGYNYPTPMKDVGMTLLLSIIVIGLGHIYIGKIARGLGIIVLCISIIAFATLLLFFYGGFIIFTIFAAFCVMIDIWSIYDAYKLTESYNKHLMQNQGNPPW